MTVLLVFLLAVGPLQVEANATGVERQGNLRCHVCEEISTVTCRRATDCSAGNTFCVTAVTRILVRFFYVSRQCTKFCPAISADDLIFRPFVLEKPMPFLYASCCRTALCNTDRPEITDSEWYYTHKDEPRVTPKAGVRVCSGSPAVVLLLTLTSVSLGLRRS
ncbi:lymphocyte antigen 6K [Molossus nigricans]